MQGSGVTLWRQIAERLRADISAGRYLRGEKLPPENQLAEVFGVNRHTLRRALAALEQDGLLIARRGRGTFVTNAQVALDYPIGERTRFSEIVSAQNREPEGRLIASSRQAADAHLARQLKIAAGTPLICLETLHVADRIPLSTTTNWLPAERFPEAITIYAETGSLTAALTHHGAGDYRRGETRITAQLVDAIDAERLNISSGMPVLVAEAVNIDRAGQPTHASRARFAADRVQMMVAGASV